MRTCSFSNKIVVVVAALFLTLTIGIQTAGAANANASVPPFVSGEVVVSGGPADVPPGYVVKKYLPNANLTVVAVEPGREMGQIQALRAKGLRANKNLIAKASFKPIDPYYRYQWHFLMIQSEAAWDITDGSGVIVAVLDTGLAMEGPDGIGCVEPGYNIVSDTSDPNDKNGHGTHVSGTIAQFTDNGVGVAGLAYGACIMPVKVLNDRGSGNFADIADGIYWAVDHGAEVINMSLGTDADYDIRTDDVMDPALEYAYDHGVTVVCASGNDGSQDNVSYPAIYSTTIAVGSVDARMIVTDYSNRGYGLDLVAPGGDTTIDSDGDGYVDGVLQETRYRNRWGYYFFQGTSMATPHVSAIAAMLYASGVATDPVSVRNILTSTALDLGATGFDSVSGHGLVQAYDALTYCTDGDGDGYCIEDGDCDDNHEDVYPGATEICDGVDNNCDGTVDEGCSGVCTDNDKDGSCEEEGDCDDSDTSIYPGATEVCGDGIDQDCDGSDLVCPVCAEPGDPCDSGADCCSGRCHPKQKVCK